MNTATARFVPRLLVIAFIAGMLETVPWGVYQIYGLSNGFSIQAAGWILPIFFAGQIFLTYPIGWLADRIGRRGLLIWTSLLSMLLMIAMYLIGHVGYGSGTGRAGGVDAEDSIADSALSTGRIAR